jgi:hypothetical protein
MSSSVRNENDENNSIKEKEKTSLVQILDELIFHMNSTRTVFKVMILSSFILAPLSLMLTAVFVIHPFFMNRIMYRFPEIGVFLLFFIGVASMSVYIGLSERKFFSNWDKKFSRYTSLKNQL